jgi:hypothetical protein
MTYSEKLQNYNQTKSGISAQQVRVKMRVGMRVRLRVRVKMRE